MPEQLPSLLLKPFPSLVSYVLILFLSLLLCPIHTLSLSLSLSLSLIHYLLRFLYVNITSLVGDGSLQSAIRFCALFLSLLVSLSLRRTPPPLFSHLHSPLQHPLFGRIPPSLPRPPIVAPHYLCRTFFPFRNFSASASYCRTFPSKTPAGESDGETGRRGGERRKRGRKKEKRE